MTIWIAMLLGLVQGLCEFLPVSSSGHLILLQRMFGVESDALFFTVMLHLATLVAVLIVYRKLVWQLLCHPFQKTVLYLILALVPTVLVALLFKKVPPFDAFYEAAESGAYLGVCFLFTGCILTGSELVRRPRKRLRGLHNMRAGSTIAGARFAGLDRKAAANFSFLLSIPSIVGGAVLEVPGALEAGAAGIDWLCVAAGMLVAGVTGYFAIRFMLRVIKRRGLWGFAIYAGLLGTAVLADQLFFHYFF